jgi:hypothetical protein
VTDGAVFSDIARLWDRVFDLESQELVAGGAMQHIKTASGGGNSILLDGIPGDAKHLEFWGALRSDVSDTGSFLHVRVNGASSGIYHWHRADAVGSAVAENTGWDANEGFDDTEMEVGRINAANAPTDDYSLLRGWMGDIVGGTKWKFFHCELDRTTAFSGDGQRFGWGKGVYRSHNKVISVTFIADGGSFTAGSTVSVYGWF